MAKVTPIRSYLKLVPPPPDDPDPTEIWQGVADVNREGFALALQMLVQLEDWEQGEHGIGLANYAALEDWTRPRRPFRNIVAEYLTAARRGGLEVEAGFCAVLTAIVGLLCSGVVPDAERYS